MKSASVSVPDATLAVRHPEPDRAVLELAGHWLSQRGLPESSGALSELQAARVSHVAFDARRVAAWDSGLVTFVLKVLGEMAARGVAADRAGLPDGVRRLIAMAEAVPERQTGRTGAQPPWLARLGTSAITTARAATVGLGFLGESLLAFGALIRRRARFRISDLLLIMQDCGPRALGIVSLISFLIGLILAFVGAVQLQQFGASIYVANLVAIAMTREIGAHDDRHRHGGPNRRRLRRQLGTHEVEPGDRRAATMGISPMEFLVLPRMLALIADDAVALPSTRTWSASWAARSSASAC